MSVWHLNAGMHTLSPIPNPTITRKGEVGPPPHTRLPIQRLKWSMMSSNGQKRFFRWQFHNPTVGFPSQQSKTFPNTAILIPSINASSLLHFLSIPLESFPHLVLIIASNFFSHFSQNFIILRLVLKLQIYYKSTSTTT